MIWKSNQLLDCLYYAIDGYIGPCRDLYFDDQQWVLRYFVLETSNTGTTRDLISPFSIGKINSREKEIHIALTSRKIKNSPEFNINLPISRQHEIALRRYYEWPEYWGRCSGTSLVENHEPILSDVSRPIEGQIDSPDSDLILSDTTEEVLPEEPVEDEFWKRNWKTEEEIQYSTVLRSVLEIEGYRVQTFNGDHSSIAELLIEDTDWDIKYLVVNLQNSHIAEYVLLTLHFVKEIDWGSSRIFVTLSQEQLENAPRYSPSQEIDTEYERKVFRYYDSL